jgi:hypothetical protein
MLKKNRPWKSLVDIILQEGVAALESLEKEEDIDRMFTKPQRSSTNVTS